MKLKLTQCIWGEGGPCSEKLGHCVYVLTYVCVCVSYIKSRICEYQHRWCLIQKRSPTTNIGIYSDTPSLGAAAPRNALKASHHTLLLVLTLSLSLLRLHPLWLTWQPGGRAQTGFRLPGLHFNGSWQWSSHFPGLIQTNFIEMALKDTTVFVEVNLFILMLSWTTRVDRSAVQYRKTAKYRNITVQLNRITSAFEAQMLGRSKSILSADLRAPARVWTWRSLVRYLGARPFQSLQTGGELLKVMWGD